LSISDRTYIQLNMSSEVSEAEYAYQDEYGKSKTILGKQKIFFEVINSISSVYM
jgi:hypothetical protein